MAPGSVSGDSGTLVLLTSIGLDRDSWQWLELPEGIAIVTPEHPGHGSRPPAAAPYDLDQLADELVDSVAGPLHLVGVSMGGSVSQHVALRHPERVRSLLLACTGPAGDPELMEQRAQGVERAGMAARLPEILPRWFTPSALEADPPHPGVEYVRRTLLALDPRAFAAAWRAIGTHDVRSGLGRISAPTTCLAAEHDPASPPERMQRFADGIPGARLVVVEDAAHMVQLERPEAFSAVLREHLDSVRAL
jgi:pimeloyl-ACP methyl ester carboxylesterase